MTKSMVYVWRDKLEAPCLVCSSKLKVCTWSSLRTLQPGYGSNFLGLDRSIDVSICADFKVCTCPAGGVFGTPLSFTPSAVNSVNGQPADVRNPWWHHIHTHICGGGQDIAFAFADWKGSVRFLEKQAIAWILHIASFRSNPDHAFGKFSSCLHWCSQPPGCNHDGYDRTSFHVYGPFSPGPYKDTRVSFSSADSTIRGSYVRPIGLDFDRWH